MLFSIKATLTVGIFFSLLLPIAFSLWYTAIDIQDRLYEEFLDFRQRTTRNIANALSDSVYYFRPIMVAWRLRC